MHPLVIEAKRDTWRKHAERDPLNLTLGYDEALSIAAAQEIMALLDEIERLQKQLGVARRREEEAQS